MIIPITTAEKIVVSIPYVIGIVCCVWLLISNRGQRQLNSPRWRLSDLEEPNGLSDDDYLFMTDTSKKKSVKVKLCVLADWLEKQRNHKGL